MHVFGWSTQHICNDCTAKEILNDNLVKGLSALPIVNIIAGIAYIAIGSTKCKENSKDVGIPYIARGAATILLGPLILLVDTITLLYRIIVKAIQERKTPQTSAGITLSPLQP